MKQTLYAALLILLVLSFSGCSRYISWGKEIFNQGEKLDTYASAVQPYIRSGRVYDQFTTLGNFDAMWLADPVRRAYARSYARKRGYTREQYCTFFTKSTRRKRSFDLILSFGNCRWPWHY